MKSFLIFLLLLILTSCNKNNEAGQSNLQAFQELVKIDPANTDSFSYLTSSNINASLSIEQQDSKEVSDIYTGISNSDSTSGNLSAQADIRLRFIKASHVNEDFLKKIAGYWVWKQEGTTWSDSTESRAGFLEKEILLREDGVVEFYDNKKLVRTERYEVRNPKSYDNYKFLIKFKNSRQVHAFWYYKTRLRFGEPNCADGCLTNDYFRK